jgi:DNA polymerase
MNMDLDELPSCRACALSTTRQRVVVGSGPAAPRLMVVGEAPGRSEDEGGEPFIGRSGQLLVRLIYEELGLERAHCFITNAVKCRPPHNRTPRVS